MARLLQQRTSTVVVMGLLGYGQRLRMNDVLTVVPAVALKQTYTIGESREEYRLSRWSISDSRDCDDVAMGGEDEICLL